MLIGPLADLQGYLKTELEMGVSRIVLATNRHREYEVVDIKIAITNTAPDNGKWPKVVFLGVGVGIINHRHPSGHDIEYWVDRSGLQMPQDHGNRLAAYTRIANEAFPEITSDEKSWGEVLFPGQSIVYEMGIPSQDIPYTEFRVEGTISRRHLLHYEHRLAPPDSYTRPPLLASLRAFNTIELHKVLDSSIQSMPKLGPDTRLAELQAYATTLSNGTQEIKATQAVLNDLYREAPHVSLQAHMRDAYQYLSQVDAALNRMAEAASSTNSEEMSEASEAIRELQSEATRINRATEELMLHYQVSDKEVGYKYRER